MGTCDVRTAYLCICVFHLVATVIRQVFDFLGFMWAPILTNFLNIVFIIFGYYGAHQYAFKYVVSYLSWSVIWLAWNIFVVCFYLNVGNLDRESHALALGTESVSWWCIWLGSGENLPCSLVAVQVEVGQAAAACILTVAIIVFAFLLPSEPPCKLTKGGIRRSVFSVESGSITASNGTLKSMGAASGAETGAKPMTPRRVKRRAASQRPPRPPRPPGGSSRRHRAPSPPASPCSAYSAYRAPRPPRRPPSRGPPAPSPAASPAPPALPGPPAYRLRPSSSLDTFM